jgi:hypothetical protein
LMNPNKPSETESLFFQNQTQSYFGFEFQFGNEKIWLRQTLSKRFLRPV